MIFRNLKFLVGFLIVSVAGCNCGKSKHIPDVSAIKADAKVIRFDQELFALDTNNIKAGVEALSAKYPDFAGPFFQNMFWNPNQPDSAEYFLQCRMFVGDSFLRHLADTCRTLYPDLNEVEKDLSRVFQFYRYYFPQAPLPKVYAFVSGYNFWTVVNEDISVLGIGLDCTFGTNHAPYLGIPNFHPYYMRRNLTKEQLVPQLVRGIAERIAGPPSGNRMIDIMVAKGKMMYLADALMPEAPDSLRLGWTAEQTEYVEGSEESLYKYLVDANLLFSTKYADFRKFVELGPFDPNFSSDNPGNSGSWLGWQMVKQYMERTPGATLESMLRDRDSQKFLQKYKPR